MAQGTASAPDFFGGDEIKRGVFWDLIGIVEIPGIFEEPADKSSCCRPYMDSSTRLGRNLPAVKKPMLAPLPGCQIRVEGAQGIVPGQRM